LDDEANPALPAIPEGKTAIFWACGVTPQQAARLESG